MTLVLLAAHSVLLVLMELITPQKNDMNALLNVRLESTHLAWEQLQSRPVRSVLLVDFLEAGQPLVLFAMLVISIINHNNHHVIATLTSAQ